MKKLKIRFIETKDGFNIQRKVWNGWKDITFQSGGGYDGSRSYSKYKESTKESLLEKVLEGYYNTCKKFVSIIEYPSIKIY